MAYQLVYTSSPRGLKPGAFGFCVVACTRGMKEQTTSALEALSGYRRIYADSRDASRNPTSYSHVLFETATGRLRILARVADAGLDYSGRTNKIASFLDVSENELAPPGPAALFSQPGLFVANWSSSSAPQYYEAPIALPNYVPIPLGCNEWRKTTGDPAWAGVLASTVATRRPVVLIARPEQNVLQLFQESLALLPPGERWKATFSTYYMKTPPGVQCQWKAVMQGSPEELALRSTPGALILDLTNPINLPSLASLVVSQEEKALVAAASGRFQTNVGPTNAFKSVPSASPAVAAPPTAPGVAPLPGAVPMSARTPFDLAPPPPSGETSPKRKTLNYGRDAILTVEPPPRRGNRGTALLTKILACFGAAAILCGIVVGILIMSGVFESIKGYRDSLDKGVAEANGQSADSSKSDGANPESTGSATSGGDVSKKDESKGSSTTEQEPKESTDSDKTKDKTSSSATEEAQSPKNANNGVQKPKEKDNKDETEEKTSISRNEAVDKPDDESDGEASNKIAKKGKDGSKFASKENENETKNPTGSGKTDDVETDDESDDKASSGADGKNKSAPKTDEKTNNKSNDEIVDDFADEIEKNLAKFEREGNGDVYLKTRELVEKYSQKVKKYRQEKVSGKLKDALERFDEVCAGFDRTIEDLKFDPLQPLTWTGTRAKNDLSSEAEIKLEDAAIYEYLSRFFEVFKNGAVRLNFRLYDSKDSPELRLFSITITANGFREEKETIKRHLGEDPDDRFYVDMQNSLGGLHFRSEESARKWLLHGTIEFEAFADTSSNESAPVFHILEKPILDCSDLSAEKRLNLSWLFKSEMPQFSISEPRANSFFVELVSDVGSDLSPVAVGDISSNKNLKPNNLLALEGSISGITGFVLVISFSRTEQGMVKGEFKQHSETSKKPDGSPPIKEVLDSHKLTFNVRYRESADQKMKASPIVGVLKVPLKR